MNHTGIIGRLTANPEIRRTGTGKAVCSFTVAVDNPGKDNGASFIPCVAWEKTAELLEKYFSKGSQLGLEGRLQSRQYENKDGKKQTVLEVVVSQIHFCGKKEDRTGFSSAEPTYSQNAFDPITDDDSELPF